MTIFGFHVANPILGCHYIGKTPKVQSIYRAYIPSVYSAATNPLKERVCVRVAKELTGVCSQGRNWKASRACCLYV